MMDMSMVLRWR
jgi:hypothetical protein